MNKIYFQGTFGAYSHLAALSIFENAEIIPCKTFDECFLKASKDDNSKIIIPESNRITGNIGIAVSYTHLRAHETLSETRMPSSA